MATYAGGASDKGPKRSQNEDGHVMVHTHRAFAVADGSGGLGSTVADAALEAFASLYRASPAPSWMPLRPDELFAGASERSVQQRNRVISAVRLANAAVSRLVTSSVALKGCATTFLAVDLDDESATFAWVGEPCAYRFSPVTGQAVALTRPHTLVNEQLAAGLINEKDALASSFKHVVTRVLGYADHVEVDSVTVAVAKGDLFALCTDGVCEPLGAAGIAGVLAKFVKTRGLHVGLTDGAQALVTAANATDGGDNATAIVIERT